MSSLRGPMMLAGPLVGAVMSFLIVPAMSWAAPLQVVGRFNLLQLWGGLATLILALGLDQAYMRYFHVVGSEQRLWRQVLGPVGALVLVLLCAAPLLAPKLGVWLFSAPRASVGLLALLYFVSSLGLRFVTVKSRMFEHGWAFILSQSLPKLALLGLISACVVSRNSLSFSDILLTALLGTAGAVIVVALMLRRHHTPRSTSGGGCADTSTLEMLGFGFPLLISALAFWGISAVGPFLLQHLGSLKQVGLLAVVMSFASPAAVVPLLIATAWVPQAFKAMGNHEEVLFVESSADQISRLIFLAYWAVGAASVAVDHVLPPTISGIGYMMPAAVAPSLWYALSEVTGIGVVISKRSVLMAVASVAALLVALGLSAVLAAPLGALGAVTALASANLVMLVLRTEFASSVWHRLPRARLYVHVGALTLLSAMSIVAERVGIGWSTRSLWFLGFLVALICSRRTVAGAVSTVWGGILRARISKSVDQRS